MGAAGTYIYGLAVGEGEDCGGVDVAARYEQFPVVDIPVTLHSVSGGGTLRMYRHDV